MLNESGITVVIKAILWMITLGYPKKKKGDLPVLTLTGRSWMMLPRPSPSKEAKGGRGLCLSHPAPAFLSTQPTTPHFSLHKTTPNFPTAD